MNLGCLQAYEGIQEDNTDDQGGSSMKVCTTKSTPGVIFSNF